MEKSRALSYKQDMSVNFMKRSVLPGIFVILFCLPAAFAQNTAPQLSTADQRRVIEILLANKFERSTEKTIYISTANLPKEIQKTFPRLKNIKVRLVSAETPNSSGLCVYEFGRFEFIDKFVSVAFGNCREGLAYDFIKTNGEWKSVGLVMTRQISY